MTFRERIDVSSLGIWNMDASAHGEVHKPASIPEEARRKYS